MEILCDWDLFLRLVILCSKHGLNREQSPPRGNEMSNAYSAHNMCLSDELITSVKNPHIYLHASFEVVLCWRG